MTRKTARGHKNQLSLSATKSFWTQGTFLKVTAHDTATICALCDEWENPQSDENKTQIIVCLSVQVTQEALPVWLFESDSMFWKVNLKHKNTFAILTP